MADVNISKYRASVVRDGSKPASPGFVVSEGQDPVNPPGTNNFVPYNGATANVELGEYGLESGFVTLDTTPTNTPTDQGTIYWDDTRSTAALIMNGTLQHIGQDVFFYVKNSSGSSIPKGTAVRFAGTNGASGHILIEPFLANGTYPSSYFMGVTSETIANGSFGQVMHFGELTGINTSGFTAGALLYASTTVAGGFQTTPPVAPNNIVLVAAAINSKNNGAIIVRPQIGSNINNDEGVKITSIANLDLLQYQSGTGLWENKTIDGAGIVTKATTQSITGTKTFGNNNLILSNIFNANATYLTNSGGASSYQSGFNFFGFNTDNHIYFAKSSNTGGNTGILAWSNTATRTYTLKDASGTLAFVSDIPSLSGYVQGSGTTNTIPIFTGASTIGNSIVTGSSSSITITSNTDGQILQIARNSGAYLWKLGIDSSSQFIIYNNSNVSTFEINPLNANATFGLGQNVTLRLGRNANDYGEVQYSGGVTSLINQWANTSAYVQQVVNGQWTRLFGTGILDQNRTSEGTFYRFQVNGSNRLILASDSSSNALIRTGNNVDLRLGVNEDAIVVKNGGNVGIGTNSPVAKLLVNLTTNENIALGSLSAIPTGRTLILQTNSNGGQIETYSSISSSYVNTLINPNGGNLLVGTTSDNGARLQVSGDQTINATQTYTLSLNNTAQDVRIQLQVNGTQTFQLSSSSSQVNIFGAANIPMIFYTNSTERMRIASTGAANFSSSVTANGLIRITRPADTSQYIDIYPSGGEGFIDAVNSLAGTFQALIFRNGNSGGITERMRITSGGNVLIGTTTDSGERLQVRNGMILAELASGSNGAIIKMGRSAGSYYWSLGIDSAASDFNFYNNSGTSVTRITPSGTLISATGVYDTTSATNHWFARVQGNNRIIADATGYVYMPFLTTGSGIDDLGWWASSGGSWTYNGMLMRISSSARYKKNIRDIEIDTSKIYDLRTISYENNEFTAVDGLTSFGLLAEDVAEKIPLLATFNNEGKPEGVQYKMLSVLLLEELKKLKIELNNLKK